MNTSEKILFDNRIKRKNVLALNEKVAAIREFEKTPVYKHVGRSFNCSPDQIKRIIQQKDEILKAWEQRTRRCNEVKSLEMKSVRVSMLGKSVYEWVRRMMYYKDFIITDGLIQKMALQFKSALGIQVFFPHQDWCDKFRQMYKISDNDTKKLKIAYTQGHSVQIKDIIRDILVPEHEANEDSSTKPTQFDTDNESNASAKVEEEADADEEDEEEEKEEKYEPPPQRPKRQAARKVRMANQTKSKTTPPPAPAKPALAKRHLVAVKLPLGTAHTNGAKLPQQVLVATPITPGANRAGATPMTMTIIPLASVAQSLNSTRAQLPNDKPIVPPPKLEIKREIEEDEPLVAIKKEYISDEEEEEYVQEKNETHEPLSFDEQAKENAKNRLGTTQNTEIARTDNEQSEEEDNLALAQLQKGLTNKSQTTTTAINYNNDNNDSTGAVTPNTWPAAPNSPHSLPAMPPLTRAPTAINSTSSNKRRHAHYDRTQALPPISSCAEARKYLKLLEDFALVKENFRLIGLITRADEVLRELDGDDDVDVV